MITLDHATRGFSRFDWLKIDVEGAEEHVLLGGLKSIAKFGPKIIVECHTFLDAGLVTKVKELISSTHAYAFEEIPRDPCVMLVARPL